MMSDTSSFPFQAVILFCHPRPSFWRPQLPVSNSCNVRVAQMWRKRLFDRIHLGHACFDNQFVHWFNRQYRLHRGDILHIYLFNNIGAMLWTLQISSRLSWGYLTYVYVAGIRRPISALVFCECVKATFCACMRAGTRPSFDCATEVALLIPDTVQPGWHDSHITIGKRMRKPKLLCNPIGWIVHIIITDHFVYLAGM